MAFGNYVSLTPAGSALVDKVKSGLEQIGNNLKSHQAAAEYSNAHPENNGSWSEFSTWYKDQMQELKEEKKYLQKLPSEAAEEAVEGIKTALSSVFGGSGNGSGRGSGSVGPSADAVLQSQTMQDYIKMINDTTAANNAWAADQAQKQMDFQKMMSDTAHQREVEDLKAAGLNPVLSASGGAGSSVAAGAMAQPDTSNTRLLAEMSMQAVDSLGANAVQLASGYNSKASNNFKNSLLGAAAKYFVPTLVRGAASAISRGLFG